MVEALLLICLFIWFPIFLYHLSHRGLFVLLGWLLVAPVATNVIEGQANPFFTMRETLSQGTAVKAVKLGGAGYAKRTTSIRLSELLEPTRILFCGLFGVVILNAVVGRKRLVPLDATEIWMGLFSLILVANTILLSRRVAFGLHTALDAFMIPFLAYYVTRRYVTSESRFHQLIQVLGYLGCYVIILCIIERLTRGELFYRIHGPFAGALQLFVVLMVVFYSVLASYRTFSPFMYRSLLYIIPIVTILTWSRGYWLALLSGMGVFFFLGRRLMAHSRKVGVIGLILISFATTAIVGLAVKDMVESRVANVDTIQWRFVKWEITLQESFKHPFFGIGLNNLRDVFGQTMGGYTTAHNSFLSLLAELGAVGLLAYFVVIISIIHTGLRIYSTGSRAIDRWRGVTVISAIVVYQAAAATITLLYTVELSQVYVYVFVGAVAGLYSRGRSAAAPDIPSNSHAPMIEHIPDSVGRVVPNFQ